MAFRSFLVKCAVYFYTNNVCTFSELPKTGKHLGEHYLINVHIHTYIQHIPVLYDFIIFI